MWPGNGTAVVDLIFMITIVVVAIAVTPKCFRRIIIGKQAVLPIGNIGVTITEWHHLDHSIFSLCLVIIIIIMAIMMVALHKQ